jgi:hypothetical protein
MRPIGKKQLRQDLIELALIQSSVEFSDGV